LAPSLDGSDDLVGIGSPDEGLGIMIGLRDEAVDGGLELDEGAEDAALEAPPRELGEKAFDSVEPGARRWGEVEDEAGMAGEPGLDLRMVAGCLIAWFRSILLSASSARRGCRDQGCLRDRHLVAA
jgi:hypothetical protein